MKILKYPKSCVDKSKFTMTSKCGCGCKVRLQDLSDIIYVKKNLEIFLLFDPDITFGWICPNCGNVIKLKRFQSWRICRILRKTGIDLDDYISWCIISNERGYDSRSNNEDENNFILFNLPMPELLYRKYVRGEDITDALRSLKINYEFISTILM